MKENNKVYLDLLKNNLIKKSNIKVVASKTRNARIRVLKDSKSKIIFLEKIITTKNYYKDKYKSKLKNGLFYSETKFLNGKKILNKRVNDDDRRIKQFYKYIKKKNICDYGCGFGGFLLKSKNIAKSLVGVEVGNNCRKFLKKNKIKNFLSISDSPDYFDLVTLFHTLHYIPNQIDTLKNIRKKLSKKGKIIIEVPHAKDFLLQDNALPEFKNFTFCKESLIWHTENSLKTFLIKSGYKKIKIFFFQRYELDNHFGWYLYNKPGGHDFYRKKITIKLKNAYKDFIVQNKFTDTLIAIAGI